MDGRLTRPFFMAREKDILKDAKERFEHAASVFSEQRDRMIEDLEFSNPADPQQWDEHLRLSRERDEGGPRPCLTFDQTNQYIAQVVNEARQNKPGINAIPVDSKGDPAVASAYEGLFRQIEYASRASQAYDTAVEHAARTGLGFIRVYAEVVDAETNEQEIRIGRVHDQMTVLIDQDYVEPDGSDAMFGFVNSVVPKKRFEKKNKGRSTNSWDLPGYYRTDDDSVMVCEYQCVHETTESRVLVDGPDGESMSMTVAEYEELATQIGFRPPVTAEFKAKKRTVKWYKLTADEVLEEADFASQWIGIVPVIGYETWIKGKRYLCGMVRRMMDGQRAYNYERSAYIETVALQPKAPLSASAEAIAGYEGDYETANVTRHAVLRYNAYGENGEKLERPDRIAPPVMSQAFVQGAIMAREDIQASIGMYRANLGAPSNETSGKAINAREKQGDVANFHYVDNLGRSIEHVGRIIVDMIPKIYDTRRFVKLAGIDGKLSQVLIDPKLSAPVQKNGKGAAEAINPNIGKYDVRVKVGPAYTTQREEVAEQLSLILQKAPDFLPILGPMWVKMQDWPDADKVANLLLSMAPPQVQEAAKEGEEASPDPRLAQAEQIIQQLHLQLQEVINSQEAAKAQNDAAKVEIDAYDAETRRMQALAPALTPEQVNAIVQQTVQQIMTTPVEVPPNDNVSNDQMHPFGGADNGPFIGQDPQSSGWGAGSQDPNGGPAGALLG